MVFGHFLKLHSQHIGGNFLDMTEKLSIRLILLGAIIIGVSIILFIWHNYNLSTTLPIDTEKFDHFGGFIAGVVGTIWSLASIILFYVTLKEQRNDFVINQKAVELQVKALEQQIKEFELQRKELEETRLIFEEQSVTQKIQRFDNTFFQLLNFHNQIVNSIDLRKNNNIGEVIGVGRDCFKIFWMRLDAIATHEAKTKFGLDKTKVDIIQVYSELFNKEQADLGHYFRNLYHIIKFVDKSEIKEKEKRKYTNLVRAQLSSYELILLYYNALSSFGNEKFRPLIEKFGLLKNMNDNLILNNYLCQEKYKQSAFN